MYSCIILNFSQNNFSWNNFSLNKFYPNKFSPNKFSLNKFSLNNFSRRHGFSLQSIEGMTHKHGFPTYPGLNGYALMPERGVSIEGFPEKHYSWNNFYQNNFSWDNFSWDNFSGTTFPGTTFPGTTFPQTTFPQTNGNFHARIWLASSPSPHSKFSLITAFLSRSTYHKSAKGSSPPVPKSYGHPKSMNKLALNEPATIH